ncbi:MAG: NepR family anti-sigma factor [Beijerinckiaceae bacterium]
MDQTANIVRIDPPGPPVLGGFVQDAIARSLRAHFDDIANAPVPDKFLVLLAELEAKEGKRGD